MLALDIRTTGRRENIIASATHYSLWRHKKIKRTTYTVKLLHTLNAKYQL